jgi:CheY-like chemotaxis protein
MGQAKSVLVIDDEPKTTTYFTTLLADNGFEAYAATSADEGLRALAAHCPDLIVLDLVMPSITGVNLFNKIKKDPRYQDVPIIIVSGIHEEFAVNLHKTFFQSLKHRKPAAYLEKPVEPGRLIQTVRHALGMGW